MKVDRSTYYLYVSKTIIVRINGFARWRPRGILHVFFQEGSWLDRPIKQKMAGRCEGPRV